MRTTADLQQPRTKSQKRTGLQLNDGGIELVKRRNASRQIGKVAGKGNKPFVGVFENHLCGKVLERVAEGGKQTAATFLCRGHFLCVRDMWKEH